MLIIFNEDRYKEFKKSGKKPSSFCKEDLKMSKVKTYDFVKNYFSDPVVLVEAIKKYHNWEFRCVIMRYPLGGLYRSCNFKFYT